MIEAVPDHQNDGPVGPSAMVAAIAAMPPGSRLLAALAGIDRTCLTADERLTVVECWERAKHWIDAEQQTDLAALHADPTHGDADWCRNEVGLAVRLHENAAGHRLAVAESLVSWLPATLAALRRGDISYLHAQEMVQATADLDDRCTADVERRAMGGARTQTRAQLRDTLRRAVAAADPEAFERRSRRKRAERRVELWPDADGMAALCAKGPAEQLAAARSVLTAIARKWKRDGVVETTDQGRFDALMALCTGAVDATSLGVVPAAVGILADATTMA